MLSSVGLRRSCQHERWEGLWAVAPNRVQYLDRRGSLLIVMPKHFRWHERQGVP